MSIMLQCCTPVYRLLGPSSLWRWYQSGNHRCGVLDRQCCSRRGAAPVPAAVTAALQHANTATMQILDTATATNNHCTDALFQILAQKYFEFDQLVVLEYYQNI